MTYPDAITRTVPPLHHLPAIMADVHDEPWLEPVDPDRTRLASFYFHHRNRLSVGLATFALATAGAVFIGAYL